MFSRQEKRTGRPQADAGMWNSSPKPSSNGSLHGGAGISPAMAGGSNAAQLMKINRKGEKSMFGDFDTSNPEAFAKWLETLDDARLAKVMNALQSKKDWDANEEAMYDRCVELLEARGQPEGEEEGEPGEDDLLLQQLEEDAGGEKSLEEELAAMMTEMGMEEDEPDPELQGLEEEMEAAGELSDEALDKFGREDPEMQAEIAETNRILGVANAQMNDKDVKKQLEEADKIEKQGRRQDKEIRGDLAHLNLIGRKLAKPL